MNDNNSESEIMIENSVISQNNRASIHSSTRICNRHKELNTAINSSSGNSTTEEKSLVMLKRMGSGTLELKPCFYCQKMPSNHYCLAEVRNSNIIAERNENKHICGRTRCILCRSTWGNAKDFANVCVGHISK